MGNSAVLVDRELAAKIGLPPHGNAQNVARAEQRIRLGKGLQGCRVEPAAATTCRERQDDQPCRLHRVVVLATREDSAPRPSPSAWSAPLRDRTSRRSVARI